MIKNTVRHKKKKSIFICQLTENSLKVIKCALLNRGRREFTGAEVESLAPDTDEKTLSERLREIFKKLEYDHEPVIVSLPRNSVASRYLKVPAQIPKEIEKIVSLQASKYLPYSANELNSGFQIIETDKDGYSNINLIIVQKEVVERYIKIFKEMKSARFTITLSSLGLCNLYHYIAPKETQAVMLVDIDANQVDLAITKGPKLLFSRSFKFNRSTPDWESLFMDEINKSNTVYLKEIGKETPTKIVFFSAGSLSREIAEVIKQKTSLTVESLSFSDSGKVNLTENTLSNILSTDNSFSSLIGLGLEDISDFMSLLPLEMKETAKDILQRKEYLRLILAISGIALIFSLGAVKNLENKAGYLKQLKTELNKLSKEAKPLEEIEKRLRLLENYSQKRISSLDVLYEIHQIIPEQISLVNLIYEEDNELIMRGQTKELNYVFEFVSRLQSSEVFKKFNTKVRYATKKKTQAGEIVDFEINCLKKL